MSRGRVLYVLNGFNRGGAEIGLATLLENGFLADADYRIVVAARLSDDLRDRVVRTTGPSRLIEASDADRLTVGSLLRLAWVLIGLLRAMRPESVVLSLKQANIVGRFVLLFFPKVHCVAFEHIAALERGRLVRVYESLLWLLSGRVDEIWADCQATLDQTRRYFRPRSRRTQIIPLFVVHPDASVKADYRIVPPLRILMAGRLIPRKRHDVVFAAVAAATRQGLDVRLYIFGDGPTRSALEVQVRALDLGDRVVFEGFVPDWWTRAPAFDVFVNLSEEEGFCIVAAEALMAGLPAIMNAVGGIPDYAREGRDSVFVAIDADAVRSQITRLAADEDLRRGLGTSAAARMRALFAPAAFRQRCIEITTSLVEPPPRR